MGYDGAHNKPTEAQMTPELKAYVATRAAAEASEQGFSSEAEIQNLMLDRLPQYLEDGLRYLQALVTRTMRDEELKNALASEVYTSCRA